MSERKVETMSHLKLVPPPKKPVDAVAGLRENLRKLNELHQRLRHMLNELEELTKENESGKEADREV